MFREYSNRISAIARLIVKLLKRCLIQQLNTAQAVARERTNKKNNAAIH